MLAGTSGVTGPQKALRTAAFFSRPLARISTRRACMIWPIPMVSACLGTCPDSGKNLALA